VRARIDTSRLAGLSIVAALASVSCGTLLGIDPGIPFDASDGDASTATTAADGATVDATEAGADGATVDATEAGADSTVESPDARADGPALDDGETGTFVDADAMSDGTAAANDAAEGGSPGDSPEADGCATDCAVQPEAASPPPEAGGVDACTPVSPCADRCGGVSVLDNCGELVQCTGSCASGEECTSSGDCCTANGCGNDCFDSCGLSDPSCCAHPQDAGADAACVVNGSACTNGSDCCSGACATSSSTGGGLCAASCVAFGSSCSLLSSICCYPTTCQGVLTPQSGDLVMPVLGRCQ
jgi:hypothetical protein